MFHWIKAFTGRCQRLNRPPLWLQALKRQNSCLKAQRAGGSIPGFGRRVIFFERSPIHVPQVPPILPKGEAARVRGWFSQVIKSDKRSGQCPASVQGWNSSLWASRCPQGLQGAECWRRHFISPEMPSYSPRTCLPGLEYLRLTMPWPWLSNPISVTYLQRDSR